METEFFFYEQLTFVGDGISFKQTPAYFLYKNMRFYVGIFIMAKINK